LTKAKRWLKRTKVERLGKKAFQVEKLYEQEECPAGGFTEQAQTQEIASRSRDLDVLDKKEIHNLTNSKRLQEIAPISRDLDVLDKMEVDHSTNAKLCLTQEITSREMTLQSRDLDRPDKTEVDHSSCVKGWLTQGISSMSRDVNVLDQMEGDHSTNINRCLTQEITSRSRDFDVPGKTKVHHSTDHEGWLTQGIMSRETTSREITSREITSREITSRSSDLDVPDRTEVGDLTNAKRCLAQETTSRSRDVELRDKTEVDHSTNAKRWLEHNRKERFGSNKKAAPPKQADPARKFDKQTSVKRTVDSEVASWMAELHKSLGLVVVCQRKDLTTVASTNDKLAKRLEDLRNYRTLRPGLNWAGNNSPFNVQGRKWEDPGNLQVAREVRREAAILLTMGIERVYGSTMLGFSR